MYANVSNNTSHYTHVKVNPPISNTHRKTHRNMHTLGASKCMHVVRSVGFAMGVGDGWVYLSSYVIERVPPLGPGK